MSKIDKRMRAGFIQFAVRYLLYFVAGCSILSAEQDSYVNFERTIQYWDFLPEVNDIEHIRPKTLSFKTSDENWNHHFWDATKRVTKLKSGKETGLIDGTFILFQRYSGQDVLIPMVSSIEWYKKRQLRQNYITELQKKIKKTLTKKNRGGSSGKSIDLVNASVAGTNVALKIKGNITVDGQIIFEDKEQVNTNMNQNKSWDLDIEQTQKFDIEGTIGDRWTIEVEQDSEADFDWENNMFLKYKGEKNDIFQKAEAGNISLNLPSTKFVSVGSGKSEGLFGLKAEYKLGPLAIQTILSREQVRKAAKSMSGGETSNSSDINDYNFIKDRYFFIEEKFKNQFYPLNSQNQHIIDPNYVIGEYEVYKRVFSMEEGVVPGGIAYIDPSDQSSHSESGSWKLLTQGQDYEIDALVGTIRLNSISSNEAVGIAYTIAEYDPDSLTFTPTQDPTSTDIDYSYDICNPETECNEESPIEDYIEGNEIEGFQLSQMSLRLIKDGSSTTPNSKTWPLMFKNVYSLGASNIDPSGLEISIVHNRGSSQEDTHSQTSGRSFLNVFNLDSENENNQFLEGGDGKIDFYGSLLNLKYGELFLPIHLPFTYDEVPRENIDGAVFDQFGNLETAENYSGPDYWGNNATEVKDILEPHLNDADNDFVDDLDDGPSMYYSTNQSDITSDHQFLIKVNHSSRGSSMTLGFMIVEGSESVTLNGRRLEKGIDYSIDYFSGTLNFLIPEATDPTAKIDVSYEENEFISFDQKLLTGTHLKYEFGERNFLSGGAFFYKQSISEKKVDIGYEPMENFIWNINGKIEQDLDFLTSSVDNLPFIETSKTSKFRIEGEYAEVYPNPNPLGQAFLDDFESSKRTTAPSIMQRQWKMSSPPVSGVNIIPDIANRGKMAWFNPYYDVNTKEIWPNQSTSTQANNTTTKTLSLQSKFVNIDENEIGWNGITTIMYSSDFDQSQSKYLDIWLNADSVHVNDNLVLHIDIGSISEDLDNDNFLDTEDDDIYGGGMGDNILNDEEDTGLDGCFDEYETGNVEDPCFNTINPDYISGTDPNGDNWNYSEGSNDYSNINGLEGNGKAMGSRYPDTEDLDKDHSLDSVNDYFTMSIKPNDEVSDPSSNIVTETESGGVPTGWKLFRLPLSKFEKRGEELVEWTDVRNMRLWVESENNSLSAGAQSILKIAKLEIVGNEWEELGEIASDSLYLSEFAIDSTFTIEVINTDENPEYSKPSGVVQETDSYSGITLKEQSLVMSFLKNVDCEDTNSDCNPGGIDEDKIFAIEKNLNLLTGDKKNSFFVYENLEMYVFGGDPSAIESWPSDGDVDLLFRIGRDDNFYEIRQPIYPEWDSRNHINLNLDKLSSNKLVIHPIENFTDSGPDSVFTVMENGCGGSLPIGHTYLGILDSLALSQDDVFNIEYFNEVQIRGSEYWATECENCSSADPNGDDYSCGLDLLCPEDEGYIAPDADQSEQLSGTEGNNSYDMGEAFIDDNSDGEYDDLSDEELYDEDNELWMWKAAYCDNQVSTTQEECEKDGATWENGYDIEAVCNNCSELRVKGEPAIDNLKYIIVGVVNRSGESLYGKVLLDELRMTGVKNEKGKAFRV
ncbi:MAG: cell surface protein SprA, partial [Candidatus Marinimicrobia bacterium]|nr:cell surface protein SprA [Candidatus Neomarinimicrobiota bacterium]